MGSFETGLVAATTFFWSYSLRRHTVHKSGGNLCSHFLGEQILHVCFWRLCAHNQLPPMPSFLHSTQIFFRFPCKQIDAPEQSLQLLGRRPCGHEPLPPHSLQRSFRRPCKQLFALTQSKHTYRFDGLCGQFMPILRHFWQL